MTAAMFPNSWATVPLEELLVHVIGGDWGKGEEYDEENFVPVVCIRGAEFRNWDVEKGKAATPRKIKATSLETRRLQLGDILIEISGGGPDQPVGRTVLIDEYVFANHPGKDLVCTNFLRLARPSDLVSSGYLNAYLKSFYMSGEVVNYQGGSNNLRNLKFKEYSKIQVPVAPAAEQKQIAAKLDELLAQVDSIKTRLDAIPAILKRFRQSVLAAAVTGRLTADWRDEDRGDWRRVQVKDIATVINGKAFPSKEYKSQGVKLLRPGNLHVSGNVVWTEKNTTYLDADWAEKRPELLLSDGALLMNLTAQSLKDEFLGRVCLLDNKDETVLLNQRIASFVSKVEYDIRPYLYIYFKSPVFREFVATLDSGSLIKHMNTKAVLAHELELPSPDEQAEIVDRTNQLMKNAELVEAMVLNAQARIARITQSTLAKAFRGELTTEWREQNTDLITEENSAESLLAKIKEQRASTIKPKRTRGRPAKKTKGVKPAMIVSILEALQKQGKPLDAQTLLAEAGYPKDASTDDVERFMLDIRDMLEQGKIQRERVGDKDMFSLLG